MTLLRKPLSSTPEPSLRVTSWGRLRKSVSACFLERTELKY